MSSFFGLLAPDIQASVKQSLEVPKEFELDLDKMQIILRDGQPGIVEGLPAIKIWIYKTLRTQRFRYDVYTWDYGHEFETLIGSTLPKEAMPAKAQQMLRDALMVNPYITDIKDVTAKVLSDKIDISFTAVTKYGEVIINGV